MKTAQKKLALQIFLGVWLGILGAGSMILWKYAGTAGRAAAHQETWPSASRLAHDRATLVVFAHPHCPCSRATIGELERLMPFVIDKADVHVVFVQPKGFALDWVHSDLWDKAAAIPGVVVRADARYAEANLFGAKTSGQTFLYDKDGALVFAGGLTSARGHMGDSDGRAYIGAWSEGKSQSRQIASVFGCSLSEGEEVK